jgi:hypothetical protein
MLITLVFFPPTLLYFQRKHLVFVSVFGKRLSRESTRWFIYDRDKHWLVYTQTVAVRFQPPCNKVAVFPFAFHIAVQQPVKPLVRYYSRKRMLQTLCYGIWPQMVEAVRSFQHQVLQQV